MRLPKNPENWTGHHVDKLINEAMRKFRRYEARVDFNAPMDVQDALYEPYLLARNEAILVARYTNWRLKDAKRLP